MPRRSSVFAVMLLCLSHCVVSQTFHPDSSLRYTAYQNSCGEWGGIYFQERGGNHRIVLQIYNLRSCSMDVLMSGIRSMGNWDGLHNPDRINPFFDKVDRDSAFALYRQLYGDRVLSLTNGVFFEAPTETSYTKLAYPLQYGGVLLSAGASPFGPRGGKYPLKVLQANDSLVRILDYDYATGLPMRDAGYPNQIATLNYRDHPNIKEFPDMAGGYKARYHLITALDYDATPGSETIVILSSNFDLTICELAEEMKLLHKSIRDENILTLDGGSSISVQDMNGVDIIAPDRGVKVPMYIGFRLKEGGNGEGPTIMNPRSGERINAGHPYFMFYFSKDGIADCMLLHNGAPVGRLVDPGAALHKGLFVWDPFRCANGSDYQVWMRSASGKVTISAPFAVERW